MFHMQRSRKRGRRIIVRQVRSKAGRHNGANANVPRGGRIRSRTRRRH